MKGLKVGHLVRAELESNLKLHPVPPVMCFNCVKPMRVDAYVLSRPVEAHCDSCSASWSDLAPYDPMCPNCGYSADHREGLGCRLEDG